MLPPPSLLLTSFALLVTIGAGLSAQTVSPERLEALRYRHIGPVGNRVSTVTGVVGDPTTYFGGAASGGIWKTTDAGLTWRPVFDDQSVHSIGALAVAPSDPSVVWAGTGESFIRSNVSIGNGVFKSIDGGETWTHMGLEGSGRISRMLIHPRNPDVVYASVLGHGYLPQPERGVFRTTDGGANWERILFVNDSTGAGDLAMDPNNPRILIAGMWQLDIKTWGRESGGVGSGLYMTKNGGDTWTRLEGHGLPTLPVGKIAVCMTPEDSDRIYALIETGDGVPWHGVETESGELWRSDDGGDTWEVMSHNRNLGGRSAYYSRCAVAPDDRDEVYFMAASNSTSLDGGRTAQTVPRARAPGWITMTSGSIQRMRTG